ncbi:DUF3006 domain-containing protein [Clostridium thailandense]|uniref:DUF3006 domain-containing protein n=1 Tax=Clostridium thailandense TaxID=2794346 RepID=UPI0035E4298E
MIGIFGVIDRFEGSFAVIELEDNKIINISIDKIPQEARVGYVIRIEKDIAIDYEQTRKRKKIIADLSDDMWN